MVKSFKFRWNKNEKLMIGPGSVKNELKLTAEKLTLCLVVGKLRKQWKKKKLQNLLLPHQAIGRHQYFASPTSKKTTNLLKTNPAQILLFINLPLQDQCWWWTHSLPCQKPEKPPLPVVLFEYLVDVYFFKSISKKKNLIQSLHSFSRKYVFT